MEPESLINWNRPQKAKTETADNMYLNGAKNMADAIRHGHVDPYMGADSRISIAMRMKQNKELLSQAESAQSHDMMSQYSKYSSVINHRNSDYSYDNTPKQSDRVKMINEMNRPPNMGQGIQPAPERKIPTT